MPPNNITKIVLAAAALVLAVIFGKMISGGDMFFVAGLILAIVAGAVTFLNPENGLILLVFSMLLSPEIELAKIPGRSISVRIDDFLLLAVFIAYVTYHAVNPRARRLVRTPIDRPLMAMILVYLVSTALGNIEGRLSPLPSMFFVLKYAQYFILFWLTANIVSSKETLKKALTAGVITAIAVSLYAYSLFPTGERVYPPFDHEAAAGGVGRVGESGSLGGYLIIVMSLALSFFMNHENFRVRYGSLGLFLFTLAPFVKTLSRASYLALAASVTALIVFSPRRKVALIAITAAALAISPIFFPALTASAVGRVKETFSGPVSELGIDLELSAAARVDSWNRALKVWLPQKPFFGHGATGVGLVDAQIPRVIGEFGLIGLFVFVWLIISSFRTSLDALRRAPDGLSASIFCGAIAALSGLMIQSIGVNTFIIVRIMTPFWFLMGMVAAAMRIIDSPPVVGTASQS